LQTGDFPAGTAFATLNLATQSGIKSLAPYKELAEQALADVFVQMLNWVEHSKQPVVAYGSRRDDPGEQYVLSAAMFDINQVYIDVELTADVPSDRMARINASAMAVRDLGYSRARALEQIGENDPHVVMQQAREEQLDEVELEIEKRRKLALGELETKRMVEQNQAAATEKKQAGKLNQLLGQSGFLEAVQRLRGGKKGQAQPKGVTGVGGQGFNPARGGTPPAVAAPGAQSSRSDEKQAEA
jgi:hypothetical protein